MINSDEFVIDFFTSDEFIIVVLSFMKDVTASFDNCALQFKWLIQGIN